jgi:hypothetical protein
LAGQRRRVLWIRDGQGAAGGRKKKLKQSVAITDVTTATHERDTAATRT